VRRMKNKEQGKVYALDWAHQANKKVFFDGKKIYKKPKINKEDIIISENIPSKIAKPYLDKNIKIFRVHANLVKDFRDNELKIEKSDENDTKAIWLYYQHHPEKFSEYKGEPVLKNLYATFKEIQKVRVASKNRAWSNGGNINEEVTKSIASVEKDVIKKMEKELKKYPVYEQFLKNIKGIGPATASGLISSSGDIKQCEMVSQLWSFFGLHTVNGIAPRPKKGERLNFDRKKRALVLGVMGDVFIKHKPEPYRSIYDREKERQLKIEYQPGVLAEKYNGYKKDDTKLLLGHAHNRAVRKMMKIFLQHYLVVYRHLLGLETRPPYQYEHLHHKDYIPPPGFEHLKPQQS